jgi:hypothetical protein
MFQSTPVAAGLSAIAGTGATFSFASNVGGATFYYNCEG